MVRRAYLSERLRDGVAPKRYGQAPQCRWHKNMRFGRTEFPTQWCDASTNSTELIPKDTICIPLDWCFKPRGGPHVNEWERLIDSHPEVANGWTKEDLKLMAKYLKAKPMILNGVLRLMPSPVDQMPCDMTVSAVMHQLQKVERHIAAGRIPVLKESTKNALIARAREYEVRTYGAPLSQLDRQTRLFE